MIAMTDLFIGTIFAVLYVGTFMLFTYFYLFIFLSSLLSGMYEHCCMSIVLFWVF